MSEDERVLGQVNNVPAEAMPEYSSLVDAVVRAGRNRWLGFVGGLAALTAVIGCDPIDKTNRPPISSPVAPATSIPNLPEPTPSAFPVTPRPGLVLPTPVSVGEGAIDEYRTKNPEIFKIGTKLEMQEALKRAGQPIPEQYQTTATQNLEFNKTFLKDSIADLEQKGRQADADALKRILKDTETQLQALQVPEIKENNSDNQLPYKQNPDGSIQFKKDNGGYGQVAEVPGLKAMLENDRTGQSTIAYKAEPGNPYGLEVGATAGVFHKETYNVGDPTESAKQVGAVVIRAEVAKNLARTVFADKPLSFPLGIDPTTSDDLDMKLALQNIYVTDTQEDYLDVKAPAGSSLVNNIIDIGDDSPVWVVKQKTGNSSIGIAPGRLPGQWTLDVFTTATLDPAHLNVKYGGVITILPGKPFFVAEFRKPFFNPPLMEGTNVEYSMHKRVVDENANKLPFKPVTTKNIWQMNDSYVALMSNQNPLLTPK